MSTHAPIVLVLASLVTIANWCGSHLFACTYELDHCAFSSSFQTIEPDRARISLIIL